MVYRNDGSNCIFFNYNHIIVQVVAFNFTAINDCRGIERLITAEDSSIPCYVIPTNEELMIARDTYMLYRSKEKEKELIENEII